MTQERPIKIAVTTCTGCLVGLETLPGGRDCPLCGERCVQAVVVLPRSRATMIEAQRLMRSVLEQMREMAR